MADIANLVEELSKLTVLEAADLVKQLETKWGVSAAARRLVPGLRRRALPRLLRRLRKTRLT
jgi:large subunit ribosomal protein L7/L12